jgi:hypothetical protein
MKSLTKVKSVLSWILGSGVMILTFILAESWLIVVSGIYGFFLVVVICFLIITPIAWIAIYLADKPAARFLDWKSRYDRKISKKEELIRKYGKFVTVVITAVTLGPIVSALLMSFLGFEKHKNYIYTSFCSLLCYVVWCGIYSGLWWGIDRVSGG